jgi:beta-fructofuranosidase
VQLYEAADPNLTEWRHRGVVFEYRDRAVWNIECPNLFKLGSKWVLLISPENPCQYFVGSLDLARGKFTADTHGVLDPGRSYASNISYDDRGRTLLWLWGRTDSDPAQGWQCCMTMPRVLSIDEEGFLRQNPAPEFETLRGDVLSMPAGPLEAKPLALGGSFAGDCLEIEAAFTLEQAAAVGIRVRAPAGGGKAGAEIVYTPGNGSFSVGAAAAPVGRQKQVRMRVFLDKGVVEAYANEGMAAIFAPLRAGPADLAVEVFARGGKAHLDSLRVWPMKAARMSLERFHV